MRRVVFKVRILSLVFFAMLAGVWPMAAQAASAPGLGSAANFAVLAGSAVTCTDGTIKGDVGVATSPPPAAMTFSTCPVTGTIHVQGDAATKVAYADFLAAYDAIADNLFPCKVLSGTLDGARLGPGTYCFPTAAALTGTLTLVGNGPWLFEIGTTGGALAATNFTVVGGNPCNVTWWVQAGVALTDTTFQGTILAGADITLTRTIIAGSVLATGAVTMTGSTVTGCEATGTGGGGGGHQACNQGVGNGPEGCDPGNSNQGNPARSNDELGGTPGNPGRKGGNNNAPSVASVNHASAPTARANSNHTSAATTRGNSSHISAAVATTKHSTSSHAKSNGHGHGLNKG